MNEFAKSGGVRESEAGGLAEAQALKRLNDASSRLWRTNSLSAGLEEILSATIELLGADMGSVQILDETSGKLKIAAQKGFHTDFLDFYQEVGVEDDSACGRALRSCERIIVEDFEQDPLCVSCLHVARNEGFRAVQSTPLIDRNGKALGMICTHFRTPHRPNELDLQLLDLYARQASDFIERCQREEKLRESEELNRMIIESSPDCVKVLDLTGRLLMINEAGRRLLDIDDDASILGQDWRALWPRSATCEGGDALAEAKAGRASHFQEFHPTFNGTPKWWDVIVTPMRGSNGEVLRILSTSRDITDRKQAEDALHEADRRKDEFLATLAHELRNPLAPIANAVYLLQKAPCDAAGADDRQALLTMVESQVNHLVQLVDDLLDVSRITTGKIKLNKRRIDLATIVREALEMSQPLIAAGHHDISVAPGEDPLVIDGDSVRLVQVFANLFNNAAKYTPRAGRIEVLMERAGDVSVVRVLDTGMGIPADMLPRIFELFTQVDHNLGRAQRGIGVGLALARRLLELHGGTIEARSEGIGRGSEFVVRLPLATNFPERDAAAPSLKTSSKPTARRVLVVDDDAAVANSFVMLLESFGVEVRVAYGGAEALRLISEFKPDLAFIDIGMPGMDGYQTARHVRELPGGNKLVLAALSGWGRAEDRAQSASAGFDHHFVKPIDIAVLENILTS